MKRIAVLITVFNRIDKTLLCLDSLFASERGSSKLTFKVFLTDDGSTDGTSRIVKERYPSENIEILHGNGQLYWNGGMINSWKRSLHEGGFDGYLWLNNDCVIFPNLWTELLEADEYAKSKFGRGGIYIGSTCDSTKSTLTYGGFKFLNKWTLKDSFIIPDGTFQECHCAHGNITYVAHNVVAKEGIFYDKYIHSGGDHDYSYLAYKHGFPVFVLRDFVGVCENDHNSNTDNILKDLSIRGRLGYLKSPLGLNLRNSLTFQKRCFPHRYVPVLISGYLRVLFPKVYYSMYRLLRKN